MSEKTTIGRDELAKAGLLPLFNSVLRAFHTPATASTDISVSFKYQGCDGSSGSIELVCDPKAQNKPKPSKKEEKPATEEPAKAENGGGGEAEG